VKVPDQRRTASRLHVQRSFGLLVDALALRRIRDTRPRSSSRNFGG
jgi:hypothetical protein